MSYHDISLRRTDTLFSRYLRELRGWKCEYCGRLGKYEEVTLYKMEASHYFSRRVENLRFDTTNVRCLCFTCHKTLGGHTKDENGPYDIWMKQLLGDTAYKQLCLRAKIYKKRDDKMDKMYIQQLIKQQNDLTGRNY